MRYWIWKLFQKKTKAILILTGIYVLIMAFFIPVQMMHMKLYVCQLYIAPVFVINVATSIYAIIIIPITLFYKFNYKIKIALGLLIMPALYILVMNVFLYKVFDFYSVKIGVTDDVHIVVVEGSIFTSSEQFFYQLEQGIFLRELTDDFSYSVEIRYDAYTVEYDDDTFAIVYEHSENEMTFVYFVIDDGKIQYIETLYVIK